VPDDHILAWLRERQRTTGQVPGRRQMIEQWALGSTRADRLRAIVIKKAASKTPLPQADQATGLNHSQVINGSCGGEPDGQ
jgi:hypothetical protein